jgi:hypothetical protein
MRPSGRRVADLKGRVDRDFSVDPALPVGIGRMELLDVPGRGGRTDAFGGGRVETDLGSQLRPQLGDAIPPPRAGGATPMVVDSAADRTRHCRRPVRDSRRSRRSPTAGVDGQLMQPAWTPPAAYSTRPPAASSSGRVRPATTG